MEKLEGTKTYNVKDGAEVVGTVALFKMENGKYCRGIAIRSIKDNLHKKRGRRIAIGRVLKAHRKGSEKKKVFCPFRKFTKGGDAYKSLIRFERAFGLGFEKIQGKAEWGAQLSAFEQALFEEGVMI